MNELTGQALLVIWFLLWTIGGYWISMCAFRLTPAEGSVVGLLVGLTTQISIVNFLVRVTHFRTAIWITAIIVFIIGLILTLKIGGTRALKIKISLTHILIIITLTYIFFLISRGLAIYDDYAHLPTISIMATGEIPPYFAYNPEIPYRYHYFALLLGAEIKAISGSLPWTAWDLARSITVAPAVLLGGYWAYRVTRQKISLFLGGVGVLFISGTRWLLLLIPDSLLMWLSSDVRLIGAGADAGPNLISSLANPWPIDGQGSYQFPFAFENGLFQSGVEGVHSVIGLIFPAILFALLLVSTRWRNGWAIVITIILVSSIGLITEIELLLLTISFFLFTVIVMIKNHGVRLPEKLAKWGFIWLLSWVIIVFQGGAWSEVFDGVIAKIFQVPPPLAYQESGFILARPSIISNQLGELSLLNIKSIIITLFEVGPVLALMPLVLIWGKKAFRAERWFEASVACAALISLGMVFVRFSGSVRNTSRLYFFVSVCSLMAVSLGLLWMRNRPHITQLLLRAIMGITFFGGIVMLGVQMPNIKNHQYSFFIEPYDVQMTRLYWNQLDADALVFDPQPSRGSTVLGRYTQAGTTWYEPIDQFTNFLQTPDVYRLREAGYSYAYLDKTYWDELGLEGKSVFLQPCVNMIHEVDEITHSQGWRKLYDIRACEK